MSKKISSFFVGFLFLLTIIILNRFFAAGMMGLSIFTLAYLTKGMRRSPKNY